MTSARSLRALNAEIRRRGNPEWYVDTRRVHPERQVKVPLVRAGDAEVIAKAFFAAISRDPDLLGRRAGILFQWAQHRRAVSA